MRRKIIRKKNENEAGETLSKIKGGKELEMAAIILNELAQRKKRKEKIDNNKNNLKEIKEKEKKTKIPVNKDKNEKMKNANNIKSIIASNSDGVLEQWNFPVQE